MKKLFVCAMALAAFVSCSKDDVQGPALDSGSKSVEITILNASTGTRAEGGVTAAGVAGDCAVASDLKVLFADGSGVILNELSLAQAGDEIHNDGKTEVGPYAPGKTEATGTYIWHNVPWQVTQIAVVRYEATDFASGTIGKNISEVEALANSEEDNIAREVADIVLYGDDDLSDTGATHRIGDIVYHVWNADVTVAPAFARFEINNFQCKDLGVANHDGKNETYGFDELLLGALTWNGKYTAKDFEGNILYGDYVPTEFKGDENTFEGDVRSNALKPNGVWSWNVDPQKFTGLTVDMTAFAYDYTIADERRSVPLVVTGLEGKNITDNQFLAENIYTLDLTFEEKNIIDPEGLCVTVKVTINPWTVNVVTPVFNKPAAASAQ